MLAPKLICPLTKPRAIARAGYAGLLKFAPFTLAHIGLMHCARKAPTLMPGGSDGALVTANLDTRKLRSASVYQHQSTIDSALTSNPLLPREFT